MAQTYEGIHQGILIVLPIATVKLQDILGFTIQTFAKAILDIKIICEHITDYNVDPILREQKYCFMRGRSEGDVRERIRSGRLSPGLPPWTSRALWSLERV